MKLNGVDYFFINPGFDFVFVIEIYVKVGGEEILEVVIVVYENVVVIMVYGYYFVIGKMVVVVVYVNVGFVNVVMGFLNVYVDDVLIFMIFGCNFLIEG